MKRLFLATAILLFAITVMAQKTDLSGTWKLKDNKSISGTLYGNAVPQQIKITQAKELLTLETNEEQQFPTDIIGTEKLPLSGKSVDATVGEKKKKKTTTAKFEKDGSKCTRVCSLYEEDGKNIYVTYTDILSMDGSNMILRRKGENFSNGEVWECESIYEKQ
jgi:hypothetical protein